MKRVALPVFIIMVALCAVVFHFCDPSPTAGKMQQTESVSEASSAQRDVNIVYYNENQTDAADTVLTSQEVTNSENMAESFDVVLPSSFAENVQPVIDPGLDAICQRYNAVGVQCAVINDGFVTGSYVYGFADRENNKAVTPDTKYRVASLSKLFTNMIFMQLVDQGITALDADISTYYGFTVRNPSHQNVAITPRMLMTHTASVIDGNSFTNSLHNDSTIAIEMLLADRGNYSSATPGTNHTYSNFSNALVGSLCEKASGMCFEDLAQNLYLEPMGIDAGYVPSLLDDISQIGLIYGGSSTLQTQLHAQFNPTLGQTVHLVQGNLTISAKDYAQLLCLLLNNGAKADGTQLLSAQSVSEILKVQFTDSAYQVGFGSFVYGNVIEGRIMFTHTGSAYGMYSCYAVDPATGDGVVVLTSGATYSQDRSTEIYSICLDLIRALMPTA